jgi:hypothetical protein
MEEFRQPYFSEERWGFFFSENLVKLYREIFSRVSVVLCGCSADAFFGGERLIEI